MFKDKNLRLAIVDESESLGEKYNFGWDFEFDEFCQLNFGKAIELDREINTGIEQFFLNLKIPKKDLLSIENLCLDGDHAVYSMITADFLAQIEYFEIHSLEGIQHCENLQDLDLNSMAQKVDLEPLTALKKLESLTLLNDATNYKSLLEIKKLKKIEIYNWNTFSIESRKELIPVLTQLKNRNCELLFSPPSKWEIL